MPYPLSVILIPSCCCISVIVITVCLPQQLLAVLVPETLDLPIELTCQCIIFILPVQTAGLQKGGHGYEKLQLPMLTYPQQGSSAEPELVLNLFPTAFPMKDE